MVRTTREGRTYNFTLADKQFYSTLAHYDSEVREWISQIEKQHLNKKSKKNNKQQPLVVGLWAARKVDCCDGRGFLHVKDAKIAQKNAPYELLVLCVGKQCLLWEYDVQERSYYHPREGYIPIEVPKALKDFLYSSQIIVVGLGINAIVKKLENETNLLIPKQMELRDLVQKKLGQVPGEFAKSNLDSLVKLAMGPEWEVVKPERMTWWGPRRGDSISNELVQYGSTEAFVVAEMTSKLLPLEPVTERLERIFEKILPKLPKLKNYVIRKYDTSNIGL